MLNEIMSLSYQLEREHGRSLPGSPTYTEVLEDMSKRGMQDERIQPAIEEYYQVMKCLSTGDNAMSELKKSRYSYKPKGVC